MNDMQSSPFNPQRLIEWIDNKQAEVKELEVVATNLKHLHTINKAQEFETLASSAVFCFCLSFVQDDKSYLDLMFKHMHSQERLDSYNSSPHHLPWYKNKINLKFIQLILKNFVWRIKM